MDQSVRKQKSGDQLAPGDWLAPEELVEGAAEVLFVLTYPASADRSRDNDGKHVQLVVREQGKTEPFTDIVAGTTLFDLASDEDQAGYREVAERAQQIADLRAVVDWLEANPWLPIPDLDVNRHLYGPDGYRTVVATAERLGVTLEKDLDDRTRMTFRKSPLAYTLLVWHKDGRPAEPAVDELGASFDSSQMADADATPLPVVGRRHEPHTGAMTEGGLVDETEAPREAKRDIDRRCPKCNHWPWDGDHGEQGCTASGGTLHWCGCEHAEPVEQPVEIVHWRTGMLPLNLTVACGAESGSFDEDPAQVTCPACLNTRKDPS